MRIYGPVVPGVLRTTLSALVITVSVAAVLRWEPTDWWWVGSAAAALVALLGSWRGIHLTTIVRHRVALTLRNLRSRRGAARSHINASAADVRTTVLLQIGSGPGDGLPLSTIASYLDRYGIRCAAIRVTSRDGGAVSETHPERVTWIGLTLSAADNLTALLARSEHMPFHQTAHVVQRRLADHLRELGWAVHLVGAEDIPWPATASECWRGALVDEGCLAAYQVRIDHSVPETLARIWAANELTMRAVQTWTVLEMTGDPARPAVAVCCAFLTADKPGSRPPIDGITPHAGDHRPALDTLNPASTTSLAGQAYPPAGLFDALRWATGGSSARLDDGLNARAPA